MQVIRFVKSKPFSISQVPEAIYAWEKGKYIPSIDNMIVIAEVYGVTVDDFIVRDVIEIECDIREAKSA